MIPDIVESGDGTGRRRRFRSGNRIVIGPTIIRTHGEWQFDPERGMEAASRRGARREMIDRHDILPGDWAMTGETERTQSPRYRFGFALTTLLGNETRYRNLRKFAERDPDVDCTWAPIRHYYLPSERDPVRLLPGPLHTRGVLFAQAWPVLRDLSSFDAVMVHQMEVLSALAARTLVRRAPLIVAAQDMPPIVDVANYPPYPEAMRPAWRRKIRLANDVWAARRAGHYIGFSRWSTDIMVQCGLDPADVAAIHVGIDLDEWTRPSEARDTGRIQLLYVAGDFARKGGPRLLDLFAERFSDRCDLHIVTKTRLPTVPANAYVHYDLTPGNAKLIDLFHRADVFVLPTLADVSSWVTLEAMASECAVAVSRVGGIPDLLTPETGVLFDPTDAADIAQAIEGLISDPDRCRAMGLAARERVEAHFDAAKNVQAILDMMKVWVDQRRAD